MIPLGDDNTERQRRPIVTAVLVALNVVAFLYELSLQSRGLLDNLLLTFGVIPAEYTHRVEVVRAVHIPTVATLVTSMFLHGGWGHLLGNLLYLWVFGDNVEDRLGRVPFLVLYLLAGAAAAGAQILANPDAVTPMIGASGAISGVLGAYIVMFPRNQVRVLIFVFVVTVPAFFVIGLWIALQLFSSYGMIVNPAAATSTGVAYMAHVGGFAAGAIAGAAARALRRPRLA